MPRPFVSIVVVSYNRRAIIVEALSSVLQQDYDPDRFEVIIADNDSTDGTVAHVREVFDQEIASGRLKVLDLKVNAGASYSLNKGLEEAAPGWDYCLKMDEDLVLEQGALRALVDCAEKYTDAGLVSGKVFLYSDRETFQAVGSHLRPRYAICKGIGVNEKDRGQFDREERFDGLCGCMLLIKKQLLDRVGRFDEDYFLYYDDHDLMFKSLQIGLGNYYTPDATGYHDTRHAGPEKFRDRRWVYYSTRSSWMFFYKNFRMASWQGVTYFAMMHVIALRTAFKVLLMSKDAGEVRNVLLALVRAYFEGARRLTRGKAEF